MPILSGPTRQVTPVGASDSVTEPSSTPSAAGARSEVEELNVDPLAVTALEPTIAPDQCWRSYASLRGARLA
jgi:hypothetical protein